MLSGSSSRPDLYAAAVSEVGVDQGINEPHAVVAHRQWQEATNTGLVRCSSTLQCALEAKSWLDDILEADAHHITEILCTAVLCLQRQWGYGTAETSSPMERRRSIGLASVRE